MFIFNTILSGFVTCSTGSIFLTVMAHTLFDFGGLGARLYFN